MLILDENSILYRFAVLNESEGFLLRSCLGSKSANLSQRGQQTQNPITGILRDETAVHLQPNSAFVWWAASNMAQPSLGVL